MLNLFILILRNTLLILKEDKRRFTPCVGICLEMHKALAIVDSIGIDKYLNNIKTVALDFRNRIKDLPVSIPKFPLSNAITPVIFEKPIATKVLLH